MKANKSLSLRENADTTRRVSAPPAPSGLEPCRPGARNYENDCADDGASVDVHLINDYNNRGLVPSLAPVLPGSHGDDGTLLSQSNLSLRKKDQTFSQCMQQNSNKFSIGGAGQSLINKSTGASTSFSSNPVVSFFTGNGVSDLLFGSPEDQARSAAALTPHTVGTAMGAPLTWGRRTTDIFDLNLLGKGGVPQTLSSGTKGVKSFLGELDNALTLGMEFATRLTVDATLTVDEAIGCTEHSPSSMMVF